MATNHQRIKKVLYALKRKWGTPITLTKEDVTYDYTTGAPTLTPDASVTVKRAIILPRKIINDFSYDLSFIAANKNFTYGAFYATSTRKIIIDKSDVGSTFDYTIDDVLFIQGKGYVIKSLEKYDEGGKVLAYFIVATELEANDGI